MLSPHRDPPHLGLSVRLGVVLQEIFSDVNLVLLGRDVKRGVAVLGCGVRGGSLDTKIENDAMK